MAQKTAPQATTASTTMGVGQTPPAPDLAVIALHRLAFGPRPGEVAAFRALPGKTPADQLQSWVEEQLHPLELSDELCDAHLAAYHYSTLDKSLSRLWYEHNTGLKPNDPNGWQKATQPLTETRKATLVRAVYSRRQLFEVLVSFWHNHFNIEPDRGTIPAIFAHYDRDVIRSHALGNFRTMLQAVATSPEMLYHLDNATSSRGGPNENYARELFELHTLGAENYLGVGQQRSVPGFQQGQPSGYVDDDVYEATRCFTGWRVNDDDYESGVHNTGSFLFYPDWHDRFEKMVLGRFLPPDQPPMKDGTDVLDALADHPGTGRFIARKLCRRLISDTPPESVVQAAAKVFTAQRHAPDQLAQVVRTIIYSAEFAQTWGEKIKTPFELLVSALRVTQAGLAPNDNTVWTLNELGQPLFGHLTPDGYPDRATAWSGTSSLLTWWRFASYLPNSQDRGIALDLMSQMPSQLRTPEQIADFWIERILNRPLYPSRTRDVIIAVLSLGGPPDIPVPRAMLPDAVTRAVSLLLISPDFYWR